MTTSQSTDSLSLHGFIPCKDGGNEYVCRHIWSLDGSRSRSSSATERSLRESLNEAEVDVVCPGAGQLTIVPVDELGRIINERSIFELLGTLTSCENMSTNEKRILAEKACHIRETSPPCSFRKIIAALISMKQAEDIPSFIDKGFADDSLPLNGVFRAGLLRLKNPMTDLYCTLTDSWSDRKKRKFSNLCSKYNSPFFTQPYNGVYHYILSQTTILPFTRRDTADVDNKNDGSLHQDAQPSEGGDNTGGFGEVLCVEIHPSHHNLPSYSTGSKANVFAVKRLTSKLDIDFRREVEALLPFAQRIDKQLVKLLATYALYEPEGKGITYHLIFPWADGSVRALWRQNPTINRSDPRNLMWIARETAAIAEALAFIHIDYANGLGPSSIQEKYGRHGDLKAENLLVYVDQSGRQPFGKIFISDFGESRFHRQDSRSLVYPRSASPSYRPPEFDEPDGRGLSRKSDIWSIGAFFLEFATWYLIDWASVSEDFPAHREEFDHQNINSDIFFRIRQGIPRAVVKPQVIDWAHRLHARRDCTQYLHDYLDLITDGMLVAERDRRIDASQLRERMILLHRHCQSSQEYYTRKCPRENRSA